MTCAHVWPDELETDAQCLQGCGLAFAEWSEPDAGDVPCLTTTSLTSIPEIGVFS
jgi:hypothetical protein